MSKLIRNRYFLFLDLIALPAASVLSFWLRLDGALLHGYREAMIAYVALATPLKLLVFYVAGMYRRYWPYASTDELVLVGTATGVATLAAMASALLLPALVPGPACPRSIPLIDGLLALVVVSGPRFAARLAWQRRRRAERRLQREVRRRVLIAGAGDAGKLLAQEMLANPQLGLVPVGYVDDDERKQGMQIHALPVLGGRYDIPGLVRAHRVQEVVIAMPTAPGPAIREVLEVCERALVPASIIPGLYDILSGTVAITQVRDIQIEDLLRRDPVIVDPEPVETMIRGARVLVTGAGGSIGSELCRQIARCEPEALILLGHGEYSIFRIANELAQRWPDLHVVRVIADVRDAARLRHVFSEQRPNIVCHAAAHKHVPMMEENVVEAVTNNVLGTRNVLRACKASGVERFVLISSDKVVCPTSVMGVTKRVAELLVHHAARRSGHRYVAVRFGNVLGSRGSVVPYFQAQIARGGPLTVTHPEVERFFMTIPEAVQLVLQAAALGQGGEVFILDMGEPVRIVDLAVDLVRLSGLRPLVRWPTSGTAGNARHQPGNGTANQQPSSGNGNGNGDHAGPETGDPSHGRQPGIARHSQPGAVRRQPGNGSVKGRDWDIEVIFTGLRPGEKLYEELIVEGEEAAPTDQPKIMVSRNGHGQLLGPAELDAAVDALAELACTGDEQALRHKLEEIVPRYTGAAAPAPIRQHELVG